MGNYRRPNFGAEAHPFTFNKQLPTADLELFKDLFEEGVQLTGDPIIYIRKDYNEIEHAFGEHLIETLKESYNLYAYIEQTEGWEGEELFSKFGLRSQEEMVCHIPKNSFFDLGFQPKIGDLIFHVTSKKLWEVEHPRDDEAYTFHPLGAHVAFIFDCKAYRFDHVEASKEFAQSENEHIQTIHEVLFGEGAVHEDPHQVDIEEKNESLDAEIVRQDIIDNSEDDPLGF